MYQALTTESDTNFHTAWKSFLFNVDMVKKVTVELNQDLSRAENLLRVGQQWSGTGCSTGHCSRVLYGETGITMVSSQFQDYLHCFLFSLTLHWGLEVPMADLPDKAAEGAFLLATKYAQETGEAEGAGAAEEGPAEGGGAHYPWDEQEVELPQDLSNLWYRAVTGAKKLDLRSLLEQVPRWSGIPSKPKQNNYRGDAQSKVDKVLRIAQQQVLHAARIQAAIYCLLNSEQPEEGQHEFAASLQLQLFQYLGDAYFVLEAERKEHSLPGSTKQDDMLFGREDINAVKWQGNVNKTFRFGMSNPRVLPLGQCRFRPFFNSGGKSKGWNFKTKGGFSGSYGSFKGFGRGRFSYGKGFGKKGISPTMFRAGCSFFSTSQVASKSQGQGGQYSATSQDGSYRTEPLSVSKIKDPMVDTASGTTAGSQLDSAGSGSKLALSRIKHNPSQKIFFSRSIGKGNFGRIFGHWGSPKSFPHNFQIPGSLVCVGEKGKRGEKKTQTHNRLSPIKLFFGHQTFQTGSLATHFPCLKKKYVCHKNRLKKCLFSFRTSSKHQTLHAHKGGRRYFPIQCRLFWPQHFTSTLDGGHESVPKTLEIKGDFGFHLLGRHSHCIPNIQINLASYKNCAGRFRGCWYADKSQKVSLGTGTKNRSLGVSHKFFGRKTRSTFRKIDFHKKRTREVNHSFPFDSKKNGSHSRHSKRFSYRPTLLKGFYRSNGFLYFFGKIPRVGHPSANSSGFKNPNKRHQGFIADLAGQKNGGKNTHKNLTFRCFQPWLGRSGFRNRSQNPRILEGPRWSTHKYKRITCRNFNHKEFGKTGRKGTPFSGQYCSLELPQEGRRQKKLLKCNAPTLFKLGPGKRNYFGNKSNSQCRDASRFLEQNKNGHRGLYPKQKYFPSSPKNICSMASSSNRHVCQPRQFSVGKICLKIPPLPKLGLQCSGNGPFQSNRMLCKSPLENYSSMAGKAQEKQTHKMPHHSTLLGWSCMVAPTSQTLGTSHPHHSGPTPLGIIHQLPGPEDASYKVAPSLCDALRFLLERKQVSPENIQLHLNKMKKLTSYDTGFKTFWAFCTNQDIDPFTSSMEEIALQLQKMNFLDKNKTKYAYSAIVCLPGFDSLKFTPLLKSCKREWNTSQPKYATFWDAQPILQKILQKPLNWKNVAQVRDRLVLSLRLLQLCRSIDLARMWRTISQVGNDFFIKIQRKGSLKPAWEQLLELPDHQKAISPVHLALAYVDLTRTHCQPGTLLFRHLQPPFKPLCANSMGSITKKMLQGLGVPPSWQAHSTRGAGVKLYKSLGLSSEQVCEIGKWKNPTAFSAHYLRLGAVKSAAHSLSAIPESAQDSPVESAETDWSITPGSIGDPGGMDQEVQALNTGEPTQPSPEVRTQSSPKPSAVARFYFAKPKEKLSEPPSARTRKKETLKNRQPRLLKQ